MHRLFTKRRGDEGFTLIELLVVVVIIGVLVAIAVPVYLNYRQGAADKSAQSDVRGAIAAVEQYYTANGNQYPGATNTNQVTSAGASLAWGTGSTAQTATASAGTVLGYRNNGGNYVLCATNENGSASTFYVYSSSSGGSVKKSTQTSMANCLSTGS